MAKTAAVQVKEAVESERLRLRELVIKHAQDNHLCSEGVNEFLRDAGLKPTNTRGRMVILTTTEIEFDTDLDLEYDAYNSADILGSITFKFDTDGQVVGPMFAEDRNNHITNIQVREFDIDITDIAEAGDGW